MTPGSVICSEELQDSVSSGTHSCESLMAKGRKAKSAEGMGQSAEEPRHKVPGVLSQASHTGCT